MYINLNPKKESLIEKAVCKYAKEKGWLVYKWSSPSNRGVPDRIFIRKGYVTFIEFKSEKGKLTPLQALTHLRLLNQEFKVHVVRTIEEGKEAIDRYENLIG